MAKKKDKKTRGRTAPVEMPLDFRAVERSAASAAREDHTENAEAPDGVSGAWT